MLVPSPDYPLWTAAISLSGGKTVHYKCDEEENCFPDLNDIRKKLLHEHVRLLLSIQIIPPDLFIVKNY